MKPSQYFSAACVLSLHVFANAAPVSTSGWDLVARDIKITPQQIETIAPKSKSCENAPSPEECATSEQAATNIAQSFETYKVTSPAEQAAVIALMAFESMDFEYNKNHFPGVPGQGTRNMQSPEFNAKYAASIPALADKLQAASGDPAKVLNVLLSDEKYDFGSGAWFLTSQCSKEVRSNLQSGSEAGWKDYISSCVGTDANDERKAYWTRAVKALGV
ncbi:hypothetical protein FE257_001846 [Aspergillus nanangensis]|uniref:Uncharacterized protein n=1 Tax=Aspergillus nanangensis TaxID=2582783 RepID=A0AAD4CDM5_ASPNN|nr:hypothetical protein FE257_001846 [Aspergillus nanangensis]